MRWRLGRDGPGARLANPGKVGLQVPRYPGGQGMNTMEHQEEQAARLEVPVVFGNGKEASVFFRARMQVTEVGI